MCLRCHASIFQKPYKYIRIFKMNKFELVELTPLSTNKIPATSNLNIQLMTKKSFRNFCKIGLDLNSEN